MEWIKCVDRLPDAEYVAYTWDGNEISSEYSMCRTTKKWEKETPMGYIIECKRPITHWMPYPKPPNEGSIC